jgi:hypothetical protein
MLILLLLGHRLLIIMGSYIGLYAIQNYLSIFLNISYLILTKLYVNVTDFIDALGS